MDEIMNVIIKQLLFDSAEIDGVRMLVMHIDNDEALVHIYYEQEFIYKVHLAKQDEGVAVSIGVPDELDNDSIPVWLQREFLLPLVATIGKLLLKPKEDKIYH